jgi:hypothetical protein
MKYRELRIGWSVFWGLACLLLIALWVRSYSHGDAFGGPVLQNSSIEFASVEGCVYVTIFEEPKSAWWFNVYRINKFALRTFTKDVPSFIGFKISKGAVNNALNYRGVVAPHWAVVLSSGIIGALAWLPYRFSLRALLIGMTLVAVGFGVVVWTVK